VPVAHVGPEVEKFPERDAPRSSINGYLSVGAPRLVEKRCGEFPDDAVAAKRRADVEAPHAQRLRHNRFDREPADAGEQSHVCSSRCPLPPRRANRNLMPAASP